MENVTKRMQQRSDKVFAPKKKARELAAEDLTDDEDDDTNPERPNAIHALFQATTKDRNLERRQEKIDRFAKRRIFKQGAPERADPNDRVIVASNFAAEMEFEDDSKLTGGISDVDIRMVKESDLQ